MELLFDAFYVPTTTPNATERGTPALYFYINGVHAQTPVRINTSRTRNKQPFTVHIRIPYGFQTNGGMQPLLGITAFAPVQTPEHKMASIHAGTSTTPLREFMSRSKNTVDLYIRHTTDARNNVQKGTLFFDRIRIQGDTRIVTSTQTMYTPVDLFRNLPGQLRAYLNSAYVQLNALQPAFPLSKLIRAPVWQCSAGALPFAAFWSSTTRMPSTETYWVHLLNIAVARFNMTTDDLARKLQILDSRERVRGVGRILAELVTAYATALPYLTDLYVSRVGRPVITEWFDYLRLRKAGDCDDVGCDIFKQFAEFTSASFKDNTLVQLQAFARQYVCSGNLGAVTQQSVGSGIMGLKEKLGAHIWSMLTPQHIWAEWRGIRRPDDLPQWLTAYGEVLVCEGTGHMDAIVGSYAQPHPTSTAVRAKRIGDQFFNQFPVLQTLQHAIGLASSTRGHASPFYRQVQWAYAFLDEHSETTPFINELYFVNRNGEHGVTFDAIARYRYGSRSIQLRALPTIGPILQAATMRALGNMCPEPPLTIAPDTSRSHLAIESLIGARATQSRHDVARIQNRFGPDVHRLSLFVPISKTARATVVLPPIFSQIKRAVHSPYFKNYGVQYAYEVLDAGEDEETHTAQYRITFLLP